MANGADNCRVYVGNLPEDILRDEVADVFSRYGRVRDVDVKVGRTRNGTAYAFIEFDYPSDAEAAADECDGMMFQNTRLRVELTGQRKPKRWTNHYSGSGPPTRSEHRVVVTGLPKQVSWQDLKDHMRAAGNVGYAVIDDNHRGIVEYENERDKIRALKILHRSEFRNRFAASVIKVYAEQDSRDFADDKSRSSISPESAAEPSAAKKRARPPIELDVTHEYDKRRRYLPAEPRGDWQGRSGSPKRSWSPDTRRDRLRRPPYETYRGSTESRSERSPNAMERARSPEDDIRARSTRRSTESRISESRGSFDRRGNSDHRRGNPDHRRGSPDRGRGSPDRERGSPDRGRGSPDRGRGSPDRRRGKSDRRRGSPDRGRGSPDRGRASPEHRRSSPGHRGSSDCRRSPDRMQRDALEIRSSNQSRVHDWRTGLSSKNASDNEAGERTLKRSELEDKVLSDDGRIRSRNTQGSESSDDRPELAE